jgi:hypothetical protein
MRTARITLLVLLAIFYVVAATEHARVVNTSKARGDQSGYLWDAQQVYRNWHGRNPPMLIGERMRMPVYAAFLALFWTPDISDAEFFEIAKAANIWLSVALLAGLALLFAWYLPPLAATNLTLIIAFGYFVFKAGYTQPELLLYFLFFCTFLVSWHLLTSAGGWRTLTLAAATGALAGVTHLTKAMMPPFVTVLIAALAFKGLRRRGELWLAGTAIALVVLTFLAVVFPYIANSKREFGEYFFNANTTYYMWYDTGAEARAILLPRTDQEGRISVPRDQLPNMSSYLATRTPGQIAARLGRGFKDMVVRSYTAYGYLKYVIIFAAVTAIAIIAAWPTFRQLARARAPLLLFLVMYAGAFLVSTAFIDAVSGTGTTRFLLVHLAPLLFVLSQVLSRPPFSEGAWRAGPVRLSIANVHPLVSAILAVDLTFWLWPRLLSTYGGF